MADDNSTFDVENLSNFSFKRIISDNSDRKLIFVEGSFTDREGSAVLILEKKAFDENNIKALCSKESSLKKLFQNDLYYNYDCFPSVELNGIKTTLIYPATEKHIKKFETKEFFLVEETPEIYNSITLPCILSDQFSVQWVYNILDHKSESERIIFEDSDKETGFMLVPDLKWDGQTIETLYLQALVNTRSIKSLRDLTVEHIPLLQNILDKGPKAIEEKYGVPKSKLRIYVHYQPSYYHFHIHFTYLQYDVPGKSTERAHMLSTVINNIQLMPNYYQKATIPFAVSEIDPIFNTLCEKGILKKTGVKSDE